MLRNADYIYENVIISDEINTTKKYCKKAQVGVDCSLSEVYKLSSAGVILKSKSNVSKYELINKDHYIVEGVKLYGWYLPKGTYMICLNEGCQFGNNDTGYLVQRSSFNRSGCTTVSSVWDPGYTSKDANGNVSKMSIRLNVDTDQGIYIEENTRIAQLLVFENESTTDYNGQFQGGSLRSNLEK